MFSFLGDVMPNSFFFARRPLAVAGSIAIVAAGLTALGSLRADRSSRAGAQIVPGAFPSIATAVKGIAKGSTNPYDSPRFETSVFGVQIQNQPTPVFDAVIEFGDDRPDPSSPDTSHTYTGHNGKVKLADVGAVWGLAYAGGDPTAAQAEARGPRTFYAAYAKSQTRFGPLGPGGVYVRSGVTTKPFVTIPNTVSATGDVADSLGGIHSTTGLDGITVVGKASLGDVELDTKEEKLYVTNLGNRRVYSVDTRSADPQASVTALPAGPNPCTDANDYRPFGLKVMGTNLMLASVCSGEAAAADLSADAYLLNLTTNTWSTTPAMHVDLGTSFTIGRWVDSSEPNGSPAAAMMFSGLDLTADGDLVIGMRGRYGDLVATDNPALAPIGNGLLTLAKRTSATTWQSFLLTDPFPSQTWAGRDPGVTPYFFTDSFDKGALNPQGAVATVPSTRTGASGSEVVSTQRDVFNFNSQGVSFFDQATADYTVDKKTTSREEIFRGQDAPFFGKASGIGDLELIATWRAFGDRVWSDTNGNGVQDAGEPGVAGVTLSLKATCGAGDAVATAVTDANGAYTFYAEPFRAYSIEIDASNFASGQPLAGLELTTANTGNDDLDSDADRATRCIAVSSAPREDVNVSYDAGVRTPAPVLYAVGDKVWIDADKNGVQDAGELPLKDITVELVGQNKTTTTDANGMYVFDGLAAGSYQIKFSGLPAGYTFTAKGSGSNTAVDSNAAASGASVGVTDTFTLGPVGSALPNMSATVPAGLVASAIDPTIDAGVVVPEVFYAVGDKVWIDANGNDRQDAGEAGIAAVAVTLVRAGADLKTTTTNATGDYFFDGLSAGSYQVRFGLPTGYIFVTKGDGSAAALDSNATTAGATIGLTDAFTLGPVSATLPNMSATVPAGITASAIDPTIDAGVRLRPADAVYALGDTVWFDRNHNGRQDAGEPGVANVSVELRPVAGASKTTKTDANGVYLFDNLAPGSYSVVFTAPASYRLTTANVGDAIGNSDADATTGATAVFELGAGKPNMSATVPAGSIAAAMNPTIDAGLWQPLAIGDRVWADTNANGRQDAGELGLAGVRVDLLDETNAPAKDANGVVVAFETTNPEGLYNFDNLVPGTYHVKFSELPVGDTLSIADAAGVPVTENSDADVTTGIAVVVLGSTNLNLAPVTAGDDVAVAVLIDRTIDAGVSHPTYSVGNRVWFDQNADGRSQLAEPGIDGVKVSLFDVSETGSLVVPARATTLTSGGGYYRFDNIDPAAYIVQVDGSNFATDGALFRFTSSTQDETNPDLDADLNDDGIGASGGPDAVSSGTVNISSNEPTAESDLGAGGQGAVDARANMTVDFGFVTTYNLAIDKALLTPELGIGSLARYRLTVTNTSPVAAEGVVVTDPLPAALKLKRVAGAGWNCSSSGRVATCVHAAPLAPGASASIDLDAEVLISNGDLVNPADVNSPRDPEDPQADNHDQVAATVVSATLPRTGASGTHGLLTIAAVLAAFGAMLVVLDRKRATAQ
jgi:uncharacterized repeat protein (TIGR01451 family)